MPERLLSSVRVLDTGGRPVGGATATTTVPGDRRTLSTSLATLPAGTYTVTWRIVSAVDGHATTGAFSFGVGGGAVAPAGPAVAAVAAGQAAGQTLAAPGPLAVAGRWAFFAGLALLTGAAACGLAVFGLRLPGQRAALLATAVAVAAAGLGAMTIDTIQQAGAPLGQVLASATGHWLAWRGAAVLGAALAVAAVLARPGRAWPLAVLGAASAGGMLAHALGGHAAAPSPVRWLHLATMWGHLVVVGIWIGGLAWLLAGLRERGEGTGADRVGAAKADPVGAAKADPVGAAKRFSRLATLSLAAVVATGMARSIDEVGGVRGLTGTGFGRALLVKLALFSGLVLLGAASHFRVVPRLRGGRAPMGRLRRNVGLELGLASAVLASAAVLSALAPGTSALRPPAGPVAAAASSPAMAPPMAPPMVRVAGADYTTSVRVTLTVSPGTAGPNRFTAQLADYDSGRPVPAVRVWLACALPNRPELGILDVDLARSAEGRWAARGSALPLSGDWDVTAFVEGAAGTVTVPLRVRVATTT